MKTEIISTRLLKVVRFKEKEKNIEDTDSHPFIPYPTMVISDVSFVIKYVTVEVISD